MTMTNMTSERGMMMMGGMPMAGATPAAAGMMPGAMPTGMNMMMVPRCTVVMEKCDGGMKMTCTCDDKTAAATLHNLCAMMAGGMCCCMMMMNGMPMCMCNLGMMGMCKMAMTDMGCTMTCTSADPACTMTIQACCDCMMSMMKMPGCSCCVMMSGMPMCCCVC